MKEMYTLLKLHTTQKLSHNLVTIKIVICELLTKKVNSPPLSVTHTHKHNCVHTVPKSTHKPTKQLKSTIHNIFSPISYLS